MTTLELPALYVDNVVTHFALSRPLLINRDPGPEETGVLLESAVALEIVDPGEDGIDLASVRVWVDGALAFDGSATPAFQSGFDGVRAELTATVDTLRVVLDPATPFDSQAEVVVRVVATVVGGAAALDESYVFVAEDRTPPRVVAAQAVGPTQLRVGFDEPVRVVDFAGFVFRALEAPAMRVSAVDAVADRSVVTVVLDTELSPDVLYEVVVSGVEDTRGNAVEPTGATAEFVGYRPPRPATRAFDLWSMLPRHNRRSDATGDLRRFIGCLQEPLDLLLTEVDRFTDIFDLERAGEEFLDLILADLGNPFPFELEAIDKRRLASVLVEMYRQKGTVPGIQNAIRFFLDIDITAVTSFSGTTLVLGESALDVNWVLGPSDSFARFAFDVEVDRALSEVERRQIRAIVNYLKPAQTHFVDLVEPAPPPDYDHWELGISELAESTDLH